MDRSISSTKGEMVHVEVVNTDDWISKISNDLLLEILSKLSTKEAIRTSVLSKRWVNVWKKTSQLCLDMRTIANTTTLLPDVSHQAAKSVTNVIKDHCGRLEKCSIYHDSDQCVNGMLKFWVQLLVIVKHTKDLTLENFSLNRKRNVTLDLPPRSFSHPSLTSLSLGRYKLEAPHAFSDGRNLKNLKLIGISAEIEVFNAVLASCTSLEVLALKTSCISKGGSLKIENHNLKFLYLSCSRIKCIEVFSPSLDILSIGSLSCEIENVVIASPRLHFNRNYWATGKIFPHTSYYISCPQQGEKSIGNEIMMNGSNVCMKMFASMSVSVDLTNAKEVEMLKQVLAAWPGDMYEVEILFKGNNAARNESESSSVGYTQNTFWEDTKPFPSAKFRAYTVWLSNFSGSYEEFALASRMITQGTVVRCMMIRPSSVSPAKKLEIEAAIARLKELPKGDEDLAIVKF
ncbi:unnamed protein product [Eruca vesicaria subsp. sativa]|uniref:F-box domain-containing protein n=1 Tax=Eruca vesicaria subsp. sativa TaxID=29727 RepID=A0ABC8JAK9_ERUVS|nr:unnamed protein product [Eruca vesicaria subsp. sativa]